MDRQMDEQTEGGTTDPRKEVERTIVLYFAVHVPRAMA